MRRVFISYAAQDQSTARRISADLKELGIDLWPDSDFRTREQWKEVIGEQLRQVEVVVVLVSPASITSDWLTNEWSTAFLHSKRVIPVLINGANFWHLPKGLQEIRAIDLSVSYSMGISELAVRLRESVASSDQKSAELVEKDVTEEAIIRVAERLGLDTRQSDAWSGIRPKSIFVAMSFDREMEPIFAAIRSAARRVGMEAERISDLKADFMVTTTILEKIDSARLVVVDLTFERPNVYFELGYARGRGKTVVTLLKADSKAHVDVRGWNYIEYIDSRPLEEELVTRFAAEIEED